MCKPSSPPPVPLKMESGAGSETGGFHLELIHGISFSGGALVILLIFGLYFLWLRCRKENANSNNSNNQHQPSHGSAPDHRHSCCIDIQTPPIPSNQYAIDMTALSNMLSGPNNRETEAGRETAPATSDELARNILSFSRLLQQQQQQQLSSPPANHYILK